MKNKLTKIFILCLFIVACKVQDPQPVVNDQNFIEPTVVVPNS